MKYEDFEDKIGKKVVVVTQEDERFSGVLSNVESEFDTPSGEEEIELYIGEAYIGIPLSDLKAILEVNE